MPHHGEVGVSHVEANDFFFIHPLLFGLLMSVYPCPAEMRRVLTQSWVSDWDGWTEASAMIDSALISHDDNLIAEELSARKAWQSHKASIFIL